MNHWTESRLSWILRLVSKFCFLGRLGGSVSWASDSWFHSAQVMIPESWDQALGPVAHVQCGAWLRFSFSFSPPLPSPLPLLLSPLALALSLLSEKKEKRKKKFCFFLKVIPVDVIYLQINGGFSKSIGDMSRNSLLNLCCCPAWDQLNCAG